MVPSLGCSPVQNEAYECNFVPKYMSYGPNFTALDDGVGYGNLAETFDLSLLGYDDHDTALVPSPGSWQSSGALEPAYWQQLSLYAGSPQGCGGDGYSAYSPDTKPVLSPQFHPFDGDFGSGIQGSGVDVAEGNRNLLLRQCLEDTSFQKKCNYKPLDIAFSKVSKVSIMIFQQL